MASNVSYVKGGTVIQCDVSVLPRPRPQMAWPIPVFTGTANSFLTLTLQPTAQTGISGVLVATPQTLPGTGAGEWTLFWTAYQGTAPSTLSWTAVPFNWANTSVTGLPALSQLINPLPGATFIAYLQRVEAGQTYTYASAQVTTPMSTAVNPDVLFQGAKAALIAQYQMQLATQTQLDTSAAATVPATATTAYDSSLTALTTWLTALTPSWTDQTQDTPLGAGGGATLKALWVTIATNQGWLQAAIAASANQANSLNYLTNADKVALLTQWKAELQTQTNLDGSAASTVPTTSHTAYDAAVTTLSTNLIAAGAPSGWATSWPDGATSGPWTGVKTNLQTWWASVAAARSALQAAISLVGSNAGTVVAQQNSASYMTNSDKIGFVAQWVAESNTQTTLDAQAVAAGVSHTAYDNAVSNVSTGLITAGAPANWASIWPDGTTSGPWTNVLLTLNSLWAAVATQRAALVANISAAGAAAAQAAAISAAATDATTKMSTATANALLQAPTLVAGLPTLPNASYPITKMVFDSVTNKLYSNVANVWKASISNVNAGDISGTLTAAQVASLAASQITGQMTASQIASVNAAAVGSGLTASQIASVSATALTGTLVDAQIAGINGSKVSGTLAALVPVGQLSGQIQASQIQANSIGAQQVAANAITVQNLTVANFDNLCPNPQCGITAPPAGSMEAAGLIYEGIYAISPNGYCRFVGLPGAGTTYIQVAQVPCNPGDVFYAEAQSQMMNSNGGNGSVLLQFNNAANSASISSVASAQAAGMFSPSKLSVTGTAPAGAGYVVLYIGIVGSPSSGNGSYFNMFYFRRCADANVIVDGTITAGKIAANAITAAQIAAGAITSAQIAAGTIQAANIAANAITAAQIAANTLTAAQIAANAITAAQIAAGTITAAQIAAGTIQASNIAAGAITASQLAANSVTATQLAAGSVTAASIAANAITAGQIAAGAIGAQQIAAHSIYSNQLTVSNLDNLVPNGNSDQTPPSGGWPSTAYEAQGLQTNSSYARSGNQLRMTSSNVAYTGFTLTPDIPCGVGDAFYLEAWVKSPNSTYPYSPRLMIWFHDINQATTLWCIASAASLSPTYQKLSISGIAPAGTVGVQVVIDSGATIVSGGGICWDDFYFRRMADANLIVDGSILTQKLAANSVMTSNFATDTGQTASSLGASGIPSGNPTAGVWLGVGSASPMWSGPGGIKVGMPVYGGSYVSYKVDAPAVMSFNALRTNYSVTSPPQYPRFWYGGNCDSSTLGGAPNINRLTLNVTYWDTTNHMAWMDMVLAPSVATDNLDSMRYATIQFYRQSAAGTTGTLTPFPAVFKVPLNDRLYQDPATDGDGVNAITTTVPFVNSGISSGYLACIVTLYNAFGPSASNCFYTPAGWTAGGSLVNNGTSFPSGLSGGGSGGSGGGGGGLGCVPAGTLLLMADGTWLPIEQAGTGMEVAAWDDQSLQSVPARIARTFVFEDRALWRIVTTDGELVCSHDHRILQGASWVPAREAVVGTPTIWRLATGQLVYSTILEANPTGDTATVYHVGLDLGHVYCAGNLLAHNMKAPN